MEQEIINFNWNNPVVVGTKLDVFKIIDNYGWQKGRFKTKFRLASWRYASNTYVRFIDDNGKEQELIYKPFGIFKQPECIKVGCITIKSLK